MNQLIDALINCQPVIGFHYTRMELAEQLAALIEKLRFTALMEPKKEDV